MKKLILLITLFAIVLQAKELNPVNVQLKWKHQFQFAGFYLAKEKGFYKDVGLDVNFIENDESKDAIQEVLNNNAQFGISNTKLVLEFLKGEPLVGLMTSFQKSPLALMTLKSSNILEPKNLKGKRVSLSKHSTEDVTLQAMLQSQNLHIKNFKSSGFKQDNLQRLIDKKIDAFSIYVSSQPYLLKERNIEYNLIYPDDYGFDFYSDILFTTKDMIKEHPQRVKGFYEATKKGWMYAFSHLEESIDIIYEKYNTSNKSKEALLFEAIELKKISGYQGDFGKLDANKIQNIINIITLLYQKKYHRTDLDDFIYNPLNYLFSQEELNYLKEKKVLRIHNEENWPPYNFNEEGMAKGFSIDYMNLLARKMNVKVDYITGPTWNEFLSMMQKDELDIILNIKKTPQREMYLNFTDKYYTAFNGIFIKQGKEKFPSLESLKGKTVGIVKGFYTQELLGKFYPEINLYLTDNTLDAMKALASEKVDAIIGQKGVIEYLAMQHTLNNIQLSSFIEDKRLQSELCLATQKENTLLASILQKAKDAISREEFLNLKRKWFNLKTVNKVLFTKDEKDYLLQKENLSMCVQPQSFPLDDIVDNRHSGIMYEIFKEIKRQIPIPINIVPTKTKEETFLKAQKQECDIITFTTKDKHPFEHYKSLQTIFSDDLVLITRLNKTFITDIRHLLTQQFVTTNRGYYQAIINYFPHIKLTYISDVDQAFELLKKRKFFGLIDIRVTSNYYIQKYGIGELKIAGKICEECKIDGSIAVLKNQSMLQQIFTKVTNTLSEETIEDIKSRWSLIQYEKAFDYKTLSTYIFLFLLTLSVIIYWTIKLKIEVNKRKTAEGKLKDLNDRLEHRVYEEIKKNRQQQFTMFQQSRHAQMGEMISMIAHQWRQPLNAISSASTSLQSKALLGKLEQEFLMEKCGKISEYINYLSSTIDDFRNFFRPDKEKNDVDVNEIIKGALFIIEDSLIEKKIQVKSSLEGDAIVNTYENELKQVVLNLIKNAEDILVEKQISAPYIHVKTYHFGPDKVILEIHDNGGGIPVSYLNKIFDPYFSTKNKKIGTGLGLYMCKTIIEEHCEGEIRVSNKENGACFKLILPVK